LIDEPDIYILDEPTNHLDIETIEWLEKLLTTGNKTVLLVSHDRYFLDNICTEIRELDKGQVFLYKGNYAYFLEKKAEREANEILAADKARNLWRKELDWMRRQPQARGTKAKARIESFYDLEEKSKGPRKKDQVELSMQVSRQGNKILEINEASFAVPNKNILSPFTYTFKKSDRIGLAGKNGSGKTTFLNLITGNIQPTSGSVSIGETTKYGYYRQEGLSFKSDERVLDIVKNVADYIEMKNGEVITASQLLTKFLFPPEKQFGFVSKLSGGEKKRLQLMRVLMANPNFLILDEPSNDLDIDTLNVLEEFLENFPGVLVLVSHDRYLIDKLTEQLFIFPGDGNIVIYNGNYADYKLEQEALVKKPEKKIEKAKAPEKKQKLNFKEQKEFEGLENEIAELEEKVNSLTEELSKTADHVELQKIAEEIEKTKTTLDEKTERWMELAEFI
jgi:ATP-binding cassette subfamily F protein uup